MSTSKYLSESLTFKRRPVGRPRKVQVGDHLTRHDGKRSKMVHFREDTITVFENRCKELGLSEHDVLDKLAQMFIINSVDVCNEVQHMMVSVQNDFNDYVRLVHEKLTIENAEKRDAVLRNKAEHEMIIKELRKYVKPRLNRINFSLRHDIESERYIDHVTALDEIYQLMLQTGITILYSDIHEVVDQMRSKVIKQ